MSFDNIYFAVLVAIPVIYFNIKIVRYGIKGIDPLTDDLIMKTNLKYVFIFEILYFLWAYSFLSHKIVFLLVTLSVINLIVKLLKLEGDKFLMYIITPICEILIILYGVFVKCKELFC
ncbi:MAG: hypothetical protein JXR48_10315 [Candidatus Delongbacteria bacterium]|nr:hypothetical protein [Candidatus Delongbacteria bacterium]MBN2835349.1 hypothetical protein [Candidatus Delongbacteria bacterium]